MVYRKFSEKVKGLKNMKTIKIIIFALIFTYSNLFCQDIRIESSSIVKNNIMNISYKIKNNSNEDVYILLNSWVITTTLKEGFELYYKPSDYYIGNLVSIYALGENGKGGTIGELSWLYTIDYMPKILKINPKRVKNISITIKNNDFIKDFSKKDKYEMLSHISYISKKQYKNTSKEIRALIDSSLETGKNIHFEIISKNIKHFNAIQDMIINKVSNCFFKSIELKKEFGKLFDNYVLCDALVKILDD